MKIALKVTQGILKFCKIYGVTFGNKYSDIKSIVTTDDYASKFLLNDTGKVSQTSTILSDNNMYYNVVDQGEMVNCDIENGTFINSILLGSSGMTNYINDGVFSGCTLKHYTINGGQFYNCIIDESNIWNFGHWDNPNGSSDFTSDWYSGVWNSGTFTGIWYDGTFNDGIFEYPGIWYNGIANGGVFDGITWYNGLAREANFIGDCTFVNGKFNDGYFADSIFNCGNFNGGRMINSMVNGGTIYNGIIENSSINGNAEIRGGKFTNVTINNGEIYNIDAFNIEVNNGNFYSGNYSNALFNGGNIFNGMYLNITGATNSLTIHNGTFKNSKFDNIYIENGNFTNCLSTGLTWLYGIYTDGVMWNSTWYDGYWNDGIFYAGDCFTTETSNIISIGQLFCDLQGIIYCASGLITITITNAGSGISDLLDIYADGSLYISNVSKIDLFNGYTFFAALGATEYGVVDQSCGSFIDFSCTSTTSTTTSEPTTTTTSTIGEPTTTTTSTIGGSTTTSTTSIGGSTTTSTTAAETTTTTTCATIYEYSYNPTSRSTKEFACADPAIVTLWAYDYLDLGVTLYSTKTGCILSNHATGSGLQYKKLVYDGNEYAVIIDSNGIISYAILCSTITTTTTHAVATTSTTHAVGTTTTTHAVGTTTTTHAATTTTTTHAATTTTTTTHAATTTTTTTILPICVEVSLRFGSTSAFACGASALPYMVNNVNSWLYATKIYYGGSNCNVSAGYGYYSDATHYRYWDGSSFGDFYNCSPATTTTTSTTTTTLCIPIGLGYSALGSTQACASSHYEFSINGVNLLSATKIFQYLNCGANADSGYYSDDTYYRYWNQLSLGSPVTCLTTTTTTIVWYTLIHQCGMPDSNAYNFNTTNVPHFSGINIWTDGTYYYTWLLQSTTSYYTPGVILNKSVSSTIYSSCPASSPTTTTTTTLAPTTTSTTTICQTISLGYNLSDGYTACISSFNTFRINKVSFLDATKLYTTNCTLPATHGYYSDGIINRYWTGGAFSGPSMTC